MRKEGKSNGTKFRIWPELLDHLERVRDQFALPDRTAARRPARVGSGSSAEVNGFVLVALEFAGEIRLLLFDRQLLGLGKM